MTGSRILKCNFFYLSFLHKVWLFIIFFGSFNTFETKYSRRLIFIAFFLNYASLSSCILTLEFHNMSNCKLTKWFLTKETSLACCGPFNGHYRPPQLAFQHNTNLHSISTAIEISHLFLFLFTKIYQTLLVLVVITAHAKRFIVSFLRNFFEAISWFFF